MVDEEYQTVVNDLDRVRKISRFKQERAISLLHSLEKPVNQWSESVENIDLAAGRGIRNYKKHEKHIKFAGLDKVKINPIRKDSNNK